MRKINRDNIPHLANCLGIMVSQCWCTAWSYIAAYWWGVSLGQGCSFHGLPVFRRHPQSRINIDDQCKFRSSRTSSLIGVNRPCIISTLMESSQIDIGAGCGFSGTVIGCADHIVIEKNVRCGANTIITDTDWHTDDPRSGANAPITIGRNVWLGINVTVLKGVTIGENTLVGAGSLVNRSLPANVIAGGHPAKVIRPI